MEFKICPNCLKVIHHGTVCPHCSSPLHIVESSFFVGKSMGKYIIREVLGKGGMGVVFRAEHSKIGKEVALKILWPSESKPAFQKRFLREARVLASLKHPNIVEVFDFDVSEWNLTFYVMEFLRGNSLREELKGEGLPVEKFMVYFSQMVSALKYAHGKGIVHRDLKPSNIYLEQTQEGKTVKILDFGLAKVVRESDQATSLTTEGIIMGTPLYISPEQVVNKNIGPHTDQYSLALMVVDMLTGTPYRAGKTMGEIIFRETRKPVPSEDLVRMGIKRGVARAIERATSPEPGERFERVEDFSREVMKHLKGSGKSSGSTLYTHRHFSSTRREKGLRFKGRRLVNYLMVLLPLFLLALGGLIFFGGKERTFKADGLTLKFIQDFSVPPDASSIIGHFSDKIFLEAPGGVYIKTLKDPSVPSTRISLPSQRIIGVSNYGRVYMVSGGNLLRENLIKGKEEVLARKVPGGNLYALSPGGRLLAVEKERTVEIFSTTEERRLFSFPKPRGKRLLGMRMGRENLVVVSPGRLEVFSLNSRKKLASLPYPQSSLAALEFLEMASLVAVGGWFDEVYVYDLRGKRLLEKIGYPGKTESLKFLPDYPTLIITKLRGILFWRPGRGIFLRVSVPEFQDHSDVEYTPFGLAVLDKETHRIRLYSLGNFPLRKRRISRKELWAIGVAEGEEYALAGGADGVLYKLSLPGLKKKDFHLHTQGITSIALMGNRSLVSSDDQTVSLWRLPRLRLERRAHLHKYLVNHILPEGDKFFWTSSSDGTLKKWSLPDLKNLYTLKLEGYNFSFFMKHREGRKALLGTWNNAILYLERRNGKWEVRKKIPVESDSIYSIIPVKKADLALCVGLYPFHLYVYDFRTEELREIDNLDQVIYWGIPLSQQEVALVGEGGIFKYSFQRAGSQVSYSWYSALNTELGEGGTMGGLVSGKLLVVGNSRGEVLVLEKGKVNFPRLGTRGFSLPR